MSNEKKLDFIIITGVTVQGRVFRPSDWAERISGQLATYQNRRIRYSPLLQPGVNREGHKCILIHPKLKDMHRASYQSLMYFAKKNQLKICHRSEDELPSTV